MSENVEDLYLKGFMAFSSKDYKAAKAYYEQVLAQEPEHQKAREGLAQVEVAAGGGGGDAPKRKKSSKEVLREIKQLYSEKKFQESLNLCQKLLAKHPNNADLQGLYARIEGRLKQQKGAAAPPPAEKSTQQFAQDADTAVSGEEGSASEGNQTAEVEKLIQRGVSLYEIQDYENAIASWKKALAIDPSNRIAQDYISNVEPLVGDGGDDDQEAVAPPQAEDKKPGKDDMVRIYNEAMGLYKASRFEDAIEKWNYILKWHPTHKETLHCLEKARAAMSQSGGGSVEVAADEGVAAPSADSKYTDLLHEAREELTHGRHMEAERILTRLSIEAPGLEGLEELQHALEERQRQITEIRSLEIEADDEEEDHTTATDDEITRYFTPETDKSHEARQVSRVERPAEAKSKGSKLGLLVGVVVIAGLATGGWFGLKYYQQQQAMKNEAPVYSFLVREVTWNSAQQKAEDFLNFGNDFRDEGEPLLAAYAYARVEDIVQPRLQILTAGGPDAPDFEVEDEVNRLQEIKAEAAAEYTKAVAGIEKVDTEPNGMDLAEAEIRRGRLEDACERMYNMLSGDMDNMAVRDKLGETLEKQALALVAENRLEDARLLFGRVATLKSAFEIPRRHEEVIQHYFHSRITSDEKDQWFYFFTN